MTNNIEVEWKYRQELSALMIEKFGRGPFNDQDISRQIVSFILDHYIYKFKEICSKEKSIQFYQYVLELHESATELTMLDSFERITQNISDTISKSIGESYLGKYRRILKFILETGCDVDMVSEEVTFHAFRQRIEPKLYDLLFLGEMILTCVESYAEHTMIDDSIEITFKDDLYIINRKHSYNAVFEHIVSDYGTRLTKHVTDCDGVEKFDKILKEAFNLSLEDIGHVVGIIHEELEAMDGEYTGVGWETLPINLHLFFDVPIKIAEQFFRGFRLDKLNKMDLLSLACKPYKLNRYLYKPILIWNVDGKDFAFFPKNAWQESIIQYITNAIPWGKAPEEWLKNEKFKNYVHKQEDDHDKWLEDSVESKIIEANLFFDRNVTHLTSKKKSTTIDIEGLGEVDFIVVSNQIKKIFILECKHLLGRYDIVNQRNDYNSFVVGSRNKKSYNETMSNKVTWFTNNKLLLQEHFQDKYKNKDFSLLDFQVDGIFVINTPTFYMYNAIYRIYTVAQISEALLGTFKDPALTVLAKQDGHQKNITLNYPYFQRPTHIDFDPFTDNN